MDGSALFTAASYRVIQRVTGLSLLCWLFGQAVFAQDLTLRFNRITVEEGLPHPSVMEILQDDQGFMWFATLHGIVRYDGYDMTTYFPAAGDPRRVPVRDVPHLYQGPSGALWLGLVFQDAKLFRYDPTQNRFRPYLYAPDRPELTFQADVCALAEDRAGRLLAGTDGQGLFVIDVPRERDGVAPADLPYRRYTGRSPHPDSLPSPYIGNTILATPDNRFWLPTRAGLCEYRPEEDRFVTYRFAADTTQDANCVLTLFSDRPDQIWVGTCADGLWLFDRNSRSFTRQYRHDPTQPYRIAADRISSIARGPNGQLWISVYLSPHSAVQVFDPATDRFRRVRDAGWGRTVNWPGSGQHLTVDRSGQVWIGLWRRGVLKYDPGKGDFSLLDPDLPAAEARSNWDIRSVVEDRDSILWLGTLRDGLIRWDRRRDEIQVFRHRPGEPGSLADNRVNSLAMGTGDYLWVATDRGLHRLHRPSGRIERLGELTAGYFQLFASRNGTIWLYAFGTGLFRLADDVTGELVAIDPVNPHIARSLQEITALTEDESGHLWLGLNWSGLLRFDPQREQFETYLPEYGVRHIHFDRSGRMWLSTHSAGLREFSREDRQIVPLPVTTRAALGLTRAIQEDAYGRLWIFTPRGLTLFDPDQRRVLRKFRSANWLLPGQDWFMDGGSFWFRSGALGFTSPSGLLRFHPDSIRIDTVAPQLALTGLTVNERRQQPGPDALLAQWIGSTEAITLRHDQNNITLDFAGLHFQSPRDNRYRYRLDDYDPVWRDGGTQRSTTYPRLPPGAYTFWLQAANADGVWSEPRAMLRIYIRPPWYANPVAYTFYLLLASGGLFLLYRAQIRNRLARAEIEKQQAINRFKSRFYTRITHEFRTPLTLIMGIADRWRERSEGLRPAFRQIHRHSQHLLQLINQLLELSKAESQMLRQHRVRADLIPLLRGVLASFASAAEEKNIELSSEIDTAHLVIDHDPAQWQSLLTNLVANALKFTPAGGRVSVRIGYESQESTLRLRVRDTGIGIPAADLPWIFDPYFRADNAPTDPELAACGTGIGLALVKDWVTSLGGRIEVSSEPGRCTEFRVAIPVQQYEEKVTHGQEIPPAARATPSVAVAPDPPLLADGIGTDRPVVLVVEDHPDLIRFLVGMLEDRYRVQSATDGWAGFERAVELVPDLIMSDVMMPKMDGFELCRRLKTDERTSHIPVILLTAKAEQKDRVAGLERGADAYLAKPFDQRELLVRLEQLIAQRRRLQTFFSSLPDLDPTVAKGYPREVAFLRKLHDHVQKHLADPDLGVQQLCRVAGLGRTQLHQKLKALTGRSTTRYIRWLRLQRARTLLSVSSLTVSEIAYAVGFSDPSFFSTCFREEYNVPPSQLRNQPGGANPERKNSDGPT